MNKNLTERQAYDDYQERSQTSGARAEQLAWAMIILLGCQMIGGSQYAEFYIMAAAGLAYLLLSVMQALWQAVAMWIIQQRIARTVKEAQDYPDWVGFGAWCFYWLKMLVLAAGAVYGVLRFIQLM
jgi:hypothetical protein